MTDSRVTHGSLSHGTLWFVIWISICVAGGIFGLLEAGIPGFVIGTIVAGVFAVPVVTSVATLAWALWLCRFKPILAGLAGAMTGVVSTAMIWSGVLDSDFTETVVTAACIGAAVPSIVAALFLLRQYAPLHSRESTAWQYSLRDLFWRFTVVALLIALSTLVVAKHFERSRGAVGVIHSSAVK